MTQNRRPFSFQVTSDKMFLSILSILLLLSCIEICFQSAVFNFCYLKVNDIGNEGTPEVLVVIPGEMNNSIY